MWEIKEHLDLSDGIINTEFTSDRFIKWDFALGSNYDLCALFPCSGSETLEDYKKERKRPILYHKNLRLFHKVPDNEIACSYCLYPAMIRDNILLIGNQQFGNIVYLKSQNKEMKIYLVKERVKKFLFFFKKKVLYNELWYLHLSEDIKENTVFYRLSEDDGAAVYPMVVSHLGATVYLGNRDKIFFYADRYCANKVELKES